MKVNIKLIGGGKLPTKAHETDAGLDCYARNYFVDNYGKICYSLGFSIEIPKGYVGLIFPRSSVSKYELSMSNSVGVIDSGFRGEVVVKFNRLNEYPYDIYKQGDRVCQLIILPYPEIELNPVAELSETERGEGGYGSTGK